MHVPVSLLFLLACVCVQSAHAQAPHGHMGVQLRGVGGPAYLYAFQDLGDDDEAGQISGFGAAFAMALGSMVAEDLALNMDLVLAHTAGAEHGVLQDTVFSAVHLGAGVTYWLMPANFYLAASLGAARSSVEGSPVRIEIEIPTSDQSEIGFGTHLAVGKQFWVSRRVGLGASLSLLASTAGNPLAGHDTNRNVLAFTLGLTGTLH